MTTVHKNLLASVTLSDGQLLAAIQDVMTVSHDWIEDYKCALGIPKEHAACVTASEATLSLIRVLFKTRHSVRLTCVRLPVVSGDVTTYKGAPDMWAGESAL